jgi:hypothetical protein
MLPPALFINGARYDDELQPTAVSAALELERAHA